jgi:ABC-type dipeptide/oligopeptide/nickel transport system permease component
MRNQIARFLLRRAMLLVPLLAVVGFLAFMLLRVGGQDPTALLAGPTATAGEIARLSQEYGLDRPVLVQFGLWGLRVLHGDLGRSWVTGRPVLSELLERVPQTLELLLLGTALGAAVGIPAGLFSAFHRGRALDSWVRFISLLGFSVPTYFLGLAMLLIFFYLLDWAPPGMGRLSLMLSPPPRITGSYALDALIAGDGEVLHSAVSQLVLPVVCVALIAAAPIIKQVRAIVVDVMGADHVHYARAQGLPPALVRSIALRSAAAPVTTFIGAELAGLVGTTSLIEYVFAWGGVGQYGLQAIIQGDFAAVQGYVLLLAVFSVGVFLVVDLAVMAMEPRARA